MSSQSVKDALDCISGERRALSSDRRVAAFPWLVAAVVLLLLINLSQLTYPQLRQLSAHEHRVVSALVEQVAEVGGIQKRAVWQDLSRALGVRGPDQMRGHHYRPATRYLLEKTES